MILEVRTNEARVSQNVGREFEEEWKSRTCVRLLQAQKVIQVATIISLGEVGFGGFLSLWAGWD